MEFSRVYRVFCECLEKMLRFIEMHRETNNIRRRKKCDELLQREYYDF